MSDRVGSVRTVTGDVHASDLGVVYAHEHLLIVGGMQVLQDADFLINDRGRAAEEIGTFIEAGGKTLVDMQPPGLGRDPEGLQALARETGALIIAATGFLHRRGPHR